MKAFERGKFSYSSSKKPKVHPKNTRSNSMGNKRAATDALKDLTSSEDEEGVRRTSKFMPVSKKDFLEKMKLVNHPILQDEEQLEMTFRYIDLANSMMRKSASRMMEMAAMEQDMDIPSKVASKGDTPPFFRGDMSTTIMVNGVDQIVRARRANGWGQALTDLFWEAKVVVRDYWVVKKQGDSVVSVLVQTISRHHKIKAIGAVNYAREQVMECAGKAQCRVNVRDAFPREQIDQVQEAYNRGYHLKRSGKIQAYRIYNQGGDSPVFEVRSMVDGKAVWGPPPPPTGETPAARQRADRGRRQENGRQGEDNGRQGGEDMEVADGGEMAAAALAGPTAAAAANGSN
jgi:hypothetical protein